MTESLRLLLDRSLDFAGLFPPASLPMEKAAPAFAADLAGPDGSMLARFVCPAGKLGDLAAWLAAAQPAASAPLPVTVLGKGGKTSGEFLAALDADLSAITAFRSRSDGRAGVGSIEVRLPADALEPPAFKKLLNAMEALLARVPENGLQPFVELPPSPLLPSQLALLAEHNAATAARRGRPAGFKLRTGGTDPAAFPPVERLASALTAARDSRVPMKCTGGLHHALPHDSASLGVRMHGYVNLLAAATLAHSTGADASTVAALLGERDSAALTFRAAGFAWRNHLLDSAAIRAARRDFLLSFGCCYLEQPRAGLSNAGWREIARDPVTV